MLRVAARAWAAKAGIGEKTPRQSHASRGETESGSGPASGSTFLRGRCFVPAFADRLPEVLGFSSTDCGVALAGAALAGSLLAGSVLDLASARLKVGDDFADGGGLAFLFQNFRDLAGSGRGEFDSGFFRFERDDIFIALHGGAFGFEASRRFRLR